MKLLILDLETTGLDPNTDNIIEFAGLLFDADTRDTITQVSCLVSCESNQAEPINKIKVATTKKVSERCYTLAELTLKNMVKECDFIVSHNAKFDRTFLQWLFKIEDKPWICSLEDIDWGEYPIGKLVNLAADHGVPVIQPHRALSDCQLLANVFKKVEDLKSMILEADKPKDIFVAQVDYEDRVLAKDAGFLWNRILPGYWAKRMTVERAIELSKKVGFRIAKVKA